MGYYAAAGSLIGGGMQMAANALDTAQMQRAYNDAMARQSEYRYQGMSDVYKGIQQWQPSQTQSGLASAAADRLGSYKSYQDIPMSLAGSLGTPLSDAQSAAEIRQSQQNAANLNSYTDWLLSNTFANLETKRNLEKTQSFAAGTASLLPYQLYKAQHAYDWLSQLGQMFSSIGMGAQSISNQSSLDTGREMTGSDWTRIQNYGM